MSDVVDSTRLRVQFGAAADQALRQHYSLAFDRVERNGGVVERHQLAGDNVVALFDDPNDAMQCAIELHQAMASSSWTGIQPILLRIGLHLGPCSVVDGRHEGLAFHLCKRIEAAAKPGETLASAAFVEAADRDGSHRVVFVGSVMLRGFESPQAIHRLLGPDERADPLTGSAYPRLLSPLIGRDIEQKTITDYLERYPLVTLHGTAGVGKTRLALEVMRNLHGAYEGGAHLVDLSGLVGKEEIVGQFLEVFGMKSATADLDLMQLCRRIGEAPTLLVVDNCELGILNARQVISQLLVSSSKTRVLATSRVPLALPVERCITIGPLSTTSDGGLSAAGTLLLERGLAVGSNLQQDAASVEAIESCAKLLDGLPLAIELRAVELRSLTPQALLQRLRRARGQVMDDDPRSLILTREIARSFENLDEPAQVLARRLAVFADGWALESAEEVCADALLPANAIYSCMDRLVEHALVHFDPSLDGRYRFSGIIRSYASRLLQESGEVQSIRQNHCRYFCCLAQKFSEELRSPHRSSAVANSIAEIENFKLAGEFLVEFGPTDLLLEFASSLGLIFLASGKFGEGLRVISRALQEAPETHVKKPQALNLLGALAMEHGELARADEAFTEAARLFLAEGDALGAAKCRANRGGIQLRLGNHEAAADLLALSVEPLHEGGLRVASAEAKNNLGVALLGCGRPAEAEDALVQSLTVLIEAGNPASVARCHQNLSELFLATDRLPNALLSARACLDSLNELPMSYHLHPLVLCAKLSLRSGNSETAGQILGFVEMHLGREVNDTLIDSEERKLMAQTLLARLGADHLKQAVEHGKALNLQGVRKLAYEAIREG